MASPGTPKHRGPARCADCQCAIFEVLQHPHLGLNLKPGQRYARCQLEAKCKGEQDKVVKLLRALMSSELFRPVHLAPDAAEGVAEGAAVEDPVEEAASVVEISPETVASSPPATPEPKKSRRRKRWKQPELSPLASTPTTPVKRRNDRGEAAPETPPPVLRRERQRQRDAAAPRAAAPATPRRELWGSPGSAKDGEVTPWPLWTPVAGLCTPPSKPAPSTPPPWPHRSPATPKSPRTPSTRYPRTVQRFQELKTSSTETRVLAFESMALQKTQHNVFMEAGIVNMLIKPSLQEALALKDLELAVATLCLAIELPITPLHLVGLRQLVKGLREKMLVLRGLLRRLLANSVTAAAAAEDAADDIHDFFDAGY
ncbi:unnamed protein product [Durusdinium trenchii]|uniref:Uncharacterized protein n=1 Tax=Durusdinium trenchii TaxID=1381693 RepID=A0ABP0PKR2_9DINO